ncbi:hypothetical protein [Endozoicomonas sp. GU-1]|uniref:hypothetical protein n=1 Tax=Endozoicomonas sp. GU-1 TaxID=3009078 RepID=UPI0022B30682|nr:hypothetical protein [Endozoicomonas sp. GU-1]WBA81098.1 hypothetical protein O2T12_22830 [Endozoicomonas sp. GU-1]WBA88662.1 hypothetical protein O3276_12005 [Endozoicomonas sp. GU-1]
MTSPTSASVYPKTEWQAQQEPETTTGIKANKDNTAKFNDLFAKVVPQPSTNIPPSDFHPLHLQSEKNFFDKSKCLQSVRSADSPPLEFKNIDAKSLANVLWASAKLLDNGLKLKMTPELKEAIAKNPKKSVPNFGKPVSGKPMFGIESLMPKNKNLIPQPPTDPLRSTEEVLQKASD